MAMKSVGIRLSVLGIALVWVSSAAATVWNEAGDAGHFTGTADVVAGSGPLNQINGVFPGPDDVDMFLIRITDPNAFSAIGTGAFPFGPPRMFLFDASGIGVAGYFDSTNGGAALSSANVSSAGLYYLAYSGFSYPEDNISSGQAIWLQTPTDIERVPDGVGAVNAVAGWSASIVPYAPTNYTINLTGAAYVPEPASGLLLVTLLAGVTRGRRCRR